MTTTRFSTIPATRVVRLELFYGLVICALLYFIFVFGTLQNPDLLQDGEGGILENVQVGVLSFCLLMSGWLAYVTQGLQRTWLTLITIALFLLLGEEISWGQHLIGWASPEWFRIHNSQQETNIHNDAWALNVLPRNCIRIAVVVGGLLYPILRAILRRDPVAMPAWLPPTPLGVPPALFATLAAVLNRSETARVWQLDISYFQLSEVEELFLYLFFLSYLVGMWRMITAEKQATA